MGASGVVTRLGVGVGAGGGHLAARHVLAVGGSLVHPLDRALQGLHGLDHPESGQRAGLRTVAAGRALQPRP